MKMFTVGPVQMYPSTTTIRSKGLIHFRTPEFGNMVKTSLKRLASHMGHSVEHGLIYLASSGTGAMEAAVQNCVNKQDKALVIDGGGFGHRFCELLAYHKIPYDSVKLRWNEALTAEHLKPFENQGFTTLFVNIHETTSGQLYDIEMLNAFCKRNNMYLIVDAISSFMADEYDMEKHGIDVTIISSQKGLCLSPGMALMALSRRMIEKVQSAENLPCVYFDLKDYLNNIDRGQTPYTPPVCIMYELQDMLNLIDAEGGCQGRLNIVHERCEYFRTRAAAAGLVIPDYPKSDMLTPIFFDDIDAGEVINMLKDRYQIYINPCGGELATKLLRVSHLGNNTLADFDDLLEKILTCVSELRNAR